MRTYSRTHPWISFDLDPSKFHPRIWLLLGEAQSKCAHIAEAHLRPSIRDELHRIYLAKGVNATTSLEGNTLTEEQVLKRIEGKLDLPKSQEYLRKEIDNIINACNTIGTEALHEGSDKIDRAWIERFNHIVLKGLEVDQKVTPGRVRDHEVFVGDYQGAPPEDCAHLLERLCEWLNDSEFIPLGEYAVSNGVLKAILAHLSIAWIHPFGDGNGRTARLLEFRILIESGVPYPAAHLLSNHYNQTRSAYYRQLRNASISGGDPLPFIEYAVEGFIDGLREQLQLITAQQHDVIWRNFVHESLGTLNKEKDNRRRDLVLDLSLKKEPVPTSEIRHISTRMAEHYAGKTDKTVSRDLRSLRDMRLIKQQSDGYIANKDLIRMFLPMKTG